MALRIGAALGGPGLIVCRKSAVGEWVDACERIVGITPFVGGVGGWIDTTRLRSALHTRDPRYWVVLHWEALRDGIANFNKSYWEFVVADEAHLIRNKDTLLAKRLKTITSRRKLALTATPTERSIAEMWSILNWLAPTKFRSYWLFFQTYVDFELEFFGGRKVIGTRTDPQTAAQLQQLVGPYVIYKTKSEVAPDLPPKLAYPVMVRPTDGQWEWYNKARKGLWSPHVGEIDEDSGLTVDHHLARITYSKAVLTLPEAFGLPKVKSAKLEWLKDWLEDNPHQRVVVLTQFRSVASALAREVDGGCAIGGVVDQAVAQFKSGEKRHLVGTIAALGGSLNLQMADVMIFFDCVHSATLMTQAEDRIHRIDITSPKTVMYLTTPDSIDVTINASFMGKWSDHQFLKEALARMEA